MKIKTLNTNTLERRSCWIDLNHIAGTIGIFDTLENMDIAEENICISFDLPCPLGICIVYKFLCLNLANAGHEKRPNLLCKIIDLVSFWSNNYMHISSHPNAYFEERGLNIDFYIQEVQGENISDINLF